MNRSLTPLVVIEVRPFRKGWIAREGDAVDPVFDQRASAVSCARFRAAGRRCEIRLFNRRGCIEETIAVDGDRWAAASVVVESRNLGLVQ